MTNRPDTTLLTNRLLRPDTNGLFTSRYSIAKHPRNAGLGLRKIKLPKCLVPDFLKTLIPINVQAKMFLEFSD